MNKFLKTLTAVAVVITLIACIGLLVACDDDTNDGPNNGGDVTEEYTYKFTVVDQNGSSVESVQVQLCTVDEDGNALICKMPVWTDGDGVVVFTEDGMPPISAGLYVIHLLDENSKQLTFTGAEYTVDGQKDYTLTLTK